MRLDIDAQAPRARHQLDRVARGWPGVQYALTDRNQIRFEHCAGVADVGSRRAMTPETRLMAASCTKVLTAAAALTLVDAGRIDLDAPLSHYYPDHPYGDAVTVRHLLAHTAGVPNPLPINWLHRIEDAAFDEDRALAAVLRSHPHLTSPPGERYAYSNLGYWLLGKVIERASGLRYTEYVEEAILRPLGIPRGDLSFVVDDPMHLARGYERACSAVGIFARLSVRAPLRDGRDGKWLRFARVYMNGPSYGGLIATARGFCRFLRSKLARTTSPLGWTSGTLGGVAYLGKPGGGPGFSGNVRIYPGVGIATAWFSNHLEFSESKIVALTNSIDAAWFEEGATS